MPQIALETTQCWWYRFISLSHVHLYRKNVVSSELCRGCAGEAEVEGSTKVKGGAETVEGETEVL